jgi:tight adherence protein C
MFEASPTLIGLMAFAAVGGLVFVAGQYLTREMRVQQRIAAPVPNGEQGWRLSEGFDAVVTKYFDEKRFKIVGPARAKLRLELLRAGFFHPNAISYYIFWRIGMVIAFPVVAYVVAEVLLAHQSSVLKFGLVALVTALAVLGPDAYISRRRRKLVEEYSSTFPDLLDLMVVCADAGLGLDASLGRISEEIGKKSRSLGMNLLLLGAETRAGRTTIEALSSLSERLCLDEARSFVGTLRQSIELGSDIGDALRVFSEEMRDKRLLRAEERANQLPVKMVIPLGVFIFPVILLVAMLPVAVRLLAIMR